MKFLALTLKCNASNFMSVNEIAYSVELVKHTCFMLQQHKIIVKNILYCICLGLLTLEKRLVLC